MTGTVESWSHIQSSRSPSSSSSSLVSSSPSKHVGSSSEPRVTQRERNYRCRRRNSSRTDLRISLLDMQVFREQAQIRFRWKSCPTLFWLFLKTKEGNWIVDFDDVFSTSGYQESLKAFLRPGHKCLFFLEKISSQDNVKRTSRDVQVSWDIRLPILGEDPRLLKTWVFFLYLIESTSL